MYILFNTNYQRTHLESEPQTQVGPAAAAAATPPSPSCFFLHQHQTSIREGSQKNCHFMVFDHNCGGGGGVSLNHTLIAKLHCFFKTLYTSSIILNL